MPVSLLDEDLLRNQTERALQLTVAALRRALLTAIGRRSRAAAAAIMEQRGPLWNPYAGFSQMTPTPAIEDYTPEDLAACLRAAALRSGNEVIDELRDLATQREVLSSDRLILPLAKDAVARIEERITTRKMGDTLLRPAEGSENDRLVRPASGTQATGSDRLLQPVEEVKAGE